MSPLVQAVQDCGLDQCSLEDSSLRRAVEVRDYQLKVKPSPPRGVQRGDATILLR